MKSVSDNTVLISVRSAESTFSEVPEGAERPNQVAASKPERPCCRRASRKRDELSRHQQCRATDPLT